ncbi:FecR domain-containing protein [Olivibacter sp. SDN3]|uniref:FecR family protein n=1 Tax=Olivibacter sp. SDN3 TaxID=2764720 RepID=UPI001651534F|nr:FecR family protein [Olivibacter sp. SDN3]QNL51663.1 FecR domain-containing protein [Olivibacter sp. SDN3]
MDQNNTQREEENQMYQRFEAWYNAVDESIAYTNTLSNHTKRSLGKEMLLQIKTRANISSSKKYKPFPFSKKILGYAAAIILLFTVFLFLQKGTTITYNTDYAEIKVIRLPDGSQVKLNGHSTLYYSKKKFNANREVWLNGEAIFLVVHKQNNQRFSVHVSDSTSIEVLGTEFNVKNRTQTSIALREGKINFQYTGKLDNYEVNIQPGQYLILDKNSSTYQLKNDVAIDAFFLWQKHKLLLNKSTLSEVLGTLKETHGLEVAIADDTLLKRDASGSMPLNIGVEDMISNIALLYDLDINKENNQFIFQSKQRVTHK